MTDEIRPRGLGRLVPGSATIKAAVLHLMLTLVAYAGTDQQQWRKPDSAQPIEPGRSAKTDASRRTASASGANYRPSARERVALRLSEILTLPQRSPGDVMTLERPCNRVIQQRRGHLHRVSRHHARVEPVEPARLRVVPVFPCCWRKTSPSSHSFCSSR